MDDFVPRGLGGMLARELGQRLAGADFEQRVIFLEDMADGVDETHRRAQMVRPVLRIGRLFGGEEIAGHAGNNRQRRRAEFDRADQLGKLLHGRFDHGRMKSV